MATIEWKCLIYLYTLLNIFQATCALESALGPRPAVPDVPRRVRRFFMLLLTIIASFIAQLLANSRQPCFIKR